MSVDRYVADLGTGKSVVEKLSDAERAELDALQNAEIARRAAEDAARAGIVYGPDAVDITDLAVVKQYVQASRTFLAEPSHTVASVAQQTERNTRAILALLRRLV